MSRRCESRRVVIAGAGSGVGLACADALAAAGAELILVDADGAALTRTAERLGVFSRYCDAISSTSADCLAHELGERFESIDVLINAAGCGYVRALAMTRMTRAMLPLLRRATGSRLIVNVASVERFGSTDHLFPYAGSHEGFDSLSTMLANELRGTRIGVVTMPSASSKQAGGDYWSDRSDQLARSDELDTAARIVELVLGTPTG